MDSEDAPSKDAPSENAPSKDAPSKDAPSKDDLLLWCQLKTKDYSNVLVSDFTDSWRDGLAFLALIHAHRPDLIAFDDLNQDQRTCNLELAFRLAEEDLGIGRVLDVEDMNKPQLDERALTTYVASYYNLFSESDQGVSPQENRCTKVKNSTTAQKHSKTSKSSDKNNRVKCNNKRSNRHDSDCETANKSSDKKYNSKSGSEILSGDDSDCETAHKGSKNIENSKSGSKRSSGDDSESETADKGSKKSEKSKSGSNRSTGDDSDSETSKSSSKYCKNSKLVCKKSNRDDIDRKNTENSPKLGNSKRDNRKSSSVDSDFETTNKISKLAKNCKRRSKKSSSDDRESKTAISSLKLNKNIKLPSKKSSCCESDSETTKTSSKQSINSKISTKKSSGDNRGSETITNIPDLGKPVEIIDIDNTEISSNVCDSYVTGICNNKDRSSKIGRNRSRKASSRSSTSSDCETDTTYKNTEKRKKPGTMSNTTDKSNSSGSDSNSMKSYSPKDKNSSGRRRNRESSNDISECSKVRIRHKSTESKRNATSRNRDRSSEIPKRSRRRNRDRSTESTKNYRKNQDCDPDVTKDTRTGNRNRSTESSESTKNFRTRNRDSSDEKTKSSRRKTRDSSSDATKSSRRRNRDSSSGTTRSYRRRNRDCNSDTTKSSRRKNRDTSSDNTQNSKRRTRDSSSDTTKTSRRRNWDSSSYDTNISRRRRRNSSSDAHKSSRRKNLKCSPDTTKSSRRRNRDTSSDTTKSSRRINRDTSSVTTKSSRRKYQDSSSDTTTGSRSISRNSSSDTTKSSRTKKQGSYPDLTKFVRRRNSRDISYDTGRRYRAKKNLIETENRTRSHSASDSSYCKSRADNGGRSYISPTASSSFISNAKIGSQKVSSGNELNARSSSNPGDSRSSDSDNMNIEPDGKSNEIAESYVKVGNKYYGDGLVLSEKEYRFIMGNCNTKQTTKTSGKTEKRGSTTKKENGRLSGASNTLETPGTLQISLDTYLAALLESQMLEKCAEESRASQSESNGSQYEWQFKDKHGAWVSYGNPDSTGDMDCVTSLTSADIEKHYNSSKRNDPLLLQSKTHQYKLNFQECTQTDQTTSISMPIRRALKQSSETSSVKQTSIGVGGASLFSKKPKVDTFHWYFQDECGSWIRYGRTNAGRDASFATTSTSEDIEKHYSQHPTEPFTISSGMNTYTLDLQKMTQTNSKTQVERKIKRETGLHSEEADANEDLSPTDMSLFPSHWSMMKGKEKNVATVQLNSACPEFVKQVSFIRQTLPNCNVKSVYRIQNKFLWKFYEIKRDFLKDQYPRIKYREEYLFHGTDARNLKSIYTGNLDWRLHGMSTGNIYGRGTYFSNSAKMSAGYCGIGQLQVMFIVKVIIGQCTVGNSNMVKPPNDSFGQPYDTTVDDVSRPSIFVKYESQEYYPEYFFEFT